MSIRSAFVPVQPGSAASHIAVEYVTELVRLVRLGQLSAADALMAPLEQIVTSNEVWQRLGKALIAACGDPGATEAWVHRQATRVLIAATERYDTERVAQACGKPATATATATITA